MSEANELLGRYIDLLDEAMSILNEWMDTDEENLSDDKWIRQHAEKIHALRNKIGELK